MKIDSGLVSFALLFIVIIVVSFGLGSYDQVTPAVARSQAELSVGTKAVTEINFIADWAFKLVLGSFFTGLGIALFNAAWKAYRTLKRNAEMKRWHSGPNANWQPKQAPGPKVTRNDLMFWSLLQGGRQGSLIPPHVRSARVDEDDDGLEIEI